MVNYHKLLFALGVGIFKGLSSEQQEEWVKSPPGFYRGTEQELCQKFLRWLSKDILRPCANDLSSKGISLMTNNKGSRYQALTTVSRATKSSSQALEQANDRLAQEWGAPVEAAIAAEEAAASVASVLEQLAALFFDSNISVTEPEFATAIIEAGELAQAEKASGKEWRENTSSFDATLTRAAAAARTARVEMYCVCAQKYAQILREQKEKEITFSISSKSNRSIRLNGRSPVYK